MSMNHHLPKKISFVPKKHHGFQVVIFLLGFLLPPLAVAARFGIGTDFFINTFLCICGYFPCHFHNFYIQNIRNNTNRSRTPKWAIKAGLVDNSDRERRLKKNEWSKRFDERNNQSTHVGQALEDGEEGNDYIPVNEEQERVRAERGRNEGLWTGQDEEFYNEDAAPNQNHWHYPTNFEGAVGDGRGKRGGNKVSTYANGSSRLSRTESSNSSNYPPAAATDADVPEWGRDYGSKRRSDKKSGGSKNGGGKKGTGGAAAWAASGNYVNDEERDDGWGGSSGGGGRAGGGGGYGGGGGGGGYSTSGGGGGGGRANSSGQAAKKQSSDPFDHEF